MPWRSCGLRRALQSTALAVLRLSSARLAASPPHTSRVSGMSTQMILPRRSRTRATSAGTRRTVSSAQASSPAAEEAERAGAGKGRPAAGRTPAVCPEPGGRAVSPGSLQTGQAEDFGGGRRRYDRPCPVLSVNRHLDRWLNRQLDGRLEGCRKHGCLPGKREGGAASEWEQDGFGTGPHDAAVSGGERKLPSGRMLEAMPGSFFCRHGCRTLRSQAGLCQEGCRLLLQRPRPLRGRSASGPCMDMRGETILVWMDRSRGLADAPALTGKGSCDAVIA